MMLHAIGLSFMVALVSCILLAVLANAAEHLPGIDHGHTRRRQLRYGQQQQNATTEKQQGIVGGSQQAGVLSYFVSLNFNDFLFVCGGSLISQDVVLTAAHCISDAMGTVEFPHSVRIAPLTNTGGGVVQVDKTKSFVHPDWNGDTRGDVAVLKLASSVDTSRFPPIRLNDCADIPFCDGTKVTTYGFGTTTPDDTGPSSTVLNMLQSEYRPAESTNDFIAVQTTSSTCVGIGDSGGPLILNGDLQVGLTSFGNGCGSGEPDGFSRISTYFGWIQRTVCTVSSNPGRYFNCGFAAGAWYRARQVVVNGVDAFSQMVGINFRGELGLIAGSLGLSDNNDSN